MKHRYTLLIYFMVVCAYANAQKAVIFGTVSDLLSENVIDFVTVYMDGTSTSVDTDQNGYYSIEVPANTKLTLKYARVGYEELSYLIDPMPTGAKRNINVRMVSSESDLNVTITGSKIDDVGIVKEEVVELKLLPSTTGNLESVLPSIALGTSSGTGGELSSQYNVRGGNYDENLVYVNDFEIFRPQLIRSGQQEGLTFPNIDLIRDLSFSSGGFQAKYGDKMSSVLDISYKRPEETRGTVSLSLLGGSAHIEGSKRIGGNAYNKLRYLVGARYKTNRYLLGSLDTEGEYSPNFSDIQAYVTYNLTRDLQVGFLGNFNTSEYNFIPTSRSTALGLINNALRLTSVFEGGETDSFINGMGGISFTYIPERDENPLFIKLLASGYRSSESEEFDIIGSYRLAQIETNFGRDDFGEEIALLGTGTQHTNARNYLYNTIANIHLKGGLELNGGENTHFIQWGLKYQRETFDDSVREWERLDSAGYSLPFSEEEVFLQQFISTENNIENNRTSFFLQNTFTSSIPDKHEIRFTGGIRGKYSSLNEELIFSPRAELLYKPLGTEKEIAFKLAGGVYYQAPFYREMRRLDGTVNTDLKSQRSIHLVTGMSYDFFWESISPKPFKLITEFYYKKLDNLVSFDIDNVKISYSGENDASGSAIGFDLRVNGEFVPGAESWVNFSLLSTREQINGVQHLRRELGEEESIEVDDVPRPTDRFFNVSMFFQDYLPMNNKFRMNLNLTVGSGLPFGIQDNNTVFRNTFRYKPYHRVDLGFGYQLWDSKKDNKRRSNPFSFTRNSWIALEVFNLLDVANVASNTWIKAIDNRQYAISNFLTSRRLNLRLRIEL